MFSVNAVLDQLGNNKFAVMTGAYDFVGSVKNKTLTFKFKGARKVNMCHIMLNEKDLYDVIFYKFIKSTGELKEVYDISDVYAEDLRGTFEQYTGLFTRL